ncbi:hypothetical protein ACVW0I_005097 [Bradyrhizobium sp. LM6.11]
MLFHFASNSIFAVSSPGTARQYLACRMNRLERELEESAVALVVGNDRVTVRIEQPVKDAEPILSRLHRVDESFGIDDVEATIAAKSFDIGRYEFTQTFRLAEMREVILDFRVRMPVRLGERHVCAPACKHQRVLAGIGAEFEHVGVAEQPRRQHQLVRKQLAPQAGIGSEFGGGFEIPERRQDLRLLTA